jgi:hypothetical protein
LLALLGAHHILHVSRIRVKGNEKGSYESTNEDSEEIYVMSCLYYHDDDAYD